MRAVSKYDAFSSFRRHWFWCDECSGCGVLCMHAQLHQLKQNEYLWNAQIIRLVKMLKSVPVTSCPIPDLSAQCALMQWFSFFFAFHFSSHGGLACFWDEELIQFESILVSCGLWAKARPCLSQRKTNIYYQLRAHRVISAQTNTSA